MNKIIIIGNLTRDPENRATQGGVPVCNFSVAVNRRYKDGDGQQQTDFFSVVAWRTLAEMCGKYLRKGSKVAIEGAMQCRNYEDKNGVKRTAWNLIANSVEFLNTKGKSDEKHEEPEFVPCEDDGDLPF